LGEGLGVERREPLPRIYIELGWRLSGVENLGGNVHVRFDDGSGRVLHMRFPAYISRFPLLPF